MKKILLTFLFLIIFIGSFFTGKTIVVKGAVPQLNLPCEEQKDPDFHSLRPYQAAPCGDAPKARFCSNKLTIVETFNLENACKKDATGCQDCHFTCKPGGGDTPGGGHVPKHDLFIELDNSTLPILGNTEDVTNSQNGSDILDDATKVNEYASWYLSGVNNRAEYGVPTTDQIVNYSGPAKKLLPGAIADAERIKRIDEANANGKPYIDEDTKQKVSEPQNHNQVVVCANKTIQLLPSWLTNFFGIGAVGLGKATPSPCYGASEYRLKNWDNTPLELLIAEIRPYVAKLVSENYIEYFLANAFIDRWTLKTPPLPWKDANGKPFASSNRYIKAYKEWRGDLCVLIPNPFVYFSDVLGGPEFPFCLGIPGVTNNEYADLYPNIPLGNPTDKKGANYLLTDDGPNFNAGAGTTIENAQDDDYSNANLYFAHTEEVFDIATTLNKTYTPKDLKNQEVPETTEKIKTYAETGGTDGGYLGMNCSAATVRTNKGDNLFPGDGGKGPELKVWGVQYDITSVDCHETNIEPPPNCFRGPPSDPKPCKPEHKLECIALVEIEMQLGTKTPYAKEIFDTTVAGSTSTFRKMFPKVTEGAPVSCIANIPAVTTVDYINHSDPPKGGDSEFKVKDIPLDLSVTNGSHMLTFPHIGSVYDYFLKGIQTALRPKGYGEPLTDNPLLCKPTAEQSCSVKVDDSAVPSKYLGQFKANFIDLANRWSAKCPGPENNFAEECYNFVASVAQKEGVNPAFALTIWLNESGASNYCEGGNTTQDMGINIPAIYLNLPKQLTTFMGMAKTKLCSGVSGFTEPMHGWLSRFQSSKGVCDPTDKTASDYYYSVKDETWSFLTSCAKGGKFGIQWPTDMSCP